jgi:hypothetical protein
VIFADYSGSVPSSLSATFNLIARRALYTKCWYMDLRVGVSDVNFVVRPELEPIGDIVARVVFLHDYQLRWFQRHVRRGIDREGSLPLTNELQVLEDDDGLIANLREHMLPTSNCCADF